MHFKCPMLSFTYTVNKLLIIAKRQQCSTGLEVSCYIVDIPACFQSAIVFACIVMRFYDVCEVFSLSFNLTVNLAKSLRNRISRHRPNVVG